MEVKIRKINISSLLACYTLKCKLQRGRESGSTQARWVATEERDVLWVHCDRTKMQMDLECVAGDEPEGMEVSWSEEENKGDLITTFNCLLGGYRKDKARLVRGV